MLFVQVIGERLFLPSDSMLSSVDSDHRAASRLATSVEATSSQRDDTRVDTCVTSQRDDTRVGMCATSQRDDTRVGMCVTS